MIKKLLSAIVLLLVCSSVLAQVSYRELNIVANGTRTTTASSSAVDTNPSSVDFRSANGVLLVDVNAVSGTSPQMVPVLYCQDQRQGELYPIFTGSPAITTAGQYAYQIEFFCRTIRGGWNLSGTTPSFTFSMDIVRQ